MTKEPTVYHRHLRISAWLGPALLVLLAGCAPGLTPRDAEQPAVFLLEIPDGPARYDPAGPTLAVSPMRSAAGYTSADMLYVEHAHQLQSFARHRWADSPARMLEPPLLAKVEQSSLFSAVSGPASHARADLRLDTELLKLQQVFTPRGSRVELVLRATLVDVRRAKLLASQVFRVIEPAAPDTPYGGVLAANRATGLLLGELQHFLERALARNSD